MLDKFSYFALKATVLFLAAILSSPFLALLGCYRIYRRLELKASYAGDAAARDKDEWRG